MWVTPDTREALVAPYLVSWRTKIETLGTLGVGNDCLGLGEEAR